MFNKKVLSLLCLIGAFTIGVAITGTQNSDKTSAKTDETKTTTQLTAGVTSAEVDVLSVDNYYIVSFVFNVNNLPNTFIRYLKNIMDSSDLNIKSITATFYISKATGLIEKYNFQQQFDIIRELNKSVKCICFFEGKYE